MTQIPDVPPTDPPASPPPADTVRPQPARGAEIGALIGGAFGLVFLVVNSSGFSTLGRIMVLVVGILAFAAILFLAFPRLWAQAGDPRRPEPRRRSARASGSSSPSKPSRSSAGRSCFAGLGYPELGVAWVSVVVGTHFFALGHVFGLRRFHLLAGVVTLCGIAGFIAFFIPAPAFIPVLAGVIPGFVLLAFGLWALAPVDAQG
ncbi:hypothetical protein IOD13_17225 [Brevibacterium casei]|nr:hypothetical protein [Brevibacterium casei]